MASPPTISRSRAGSVSVPDVAAEEVASASRLSTAVVMALTIAALYLGRQVLIPLALAVVFAFLLSPVVEVLESCHLGRFLSVLIVLVVAFVLIVAVAWGVTNQLLQVTERLPDYSENIHNKIEALRSPAQGELGKATATVDQVSKELSAASQTAEKDKLGKTKQPIPVQVSAPPRSGADYLRDLLGPLTGVLENAAVVAIFTLFILLRREDLRNRLLRLAGRSQLSVMTEAISEASTRLSRYLLLQFAVNIGYGALFGLGIYLIGIPHAGLWGVFASVLRFLPYIGTLVAAAFPMGMALAIFPGWTQVGLVFVLFVLLELVIANLIEPWLYGTHTGISSLAVLVAAIFWGMLWGPAGLILSTPLTVCLLLIGRHVPQLRFLEIVLGDKPVLPPSAHLYQRLLAFDEDEAREIADCYLKENPLGSLYDSVLVPALGLAEQDRHVNAIDESKMAFVQQSVKELIEELQERDLAESGAASAVPEVAPVAGSKIVCLPARDEADEIVGMMAAQLLQRAGHEAEALPIGPVASMLKQIEVSRPAVVCVSALPPFAASHARSLCKQIRQCLPDATIVLGLWQYPGGTAKAQERLRNHSADLVGTSLAQIVALIGESQTGQSKTADPRVVASRAGTAVVQVGD